MDIETIVKLPGVTLLDVREPLELIAEGDVPNAVNIPMGQIADKLEEVRQMNRPIVVFCRSGNRSGKIKDYLESQGLKEIYNGGGFNDVLQALES